MSGAHRAVLVIAEDYQQFKRVMRRRNSKCDVTPTLRYVADSRSMMGLKNPLVLLIGHFWDRMDWRELETHLEIIQAEVIEVYGERI